MTTPFGTRDPNSLFGLSQSISQPQSDSQTVTKTSLQSLAPWKPGKIDLLTSILRLQFLSTWASPAYQTPEKTKGFQDNANLWGGTNLSLDDPDILGVMLQWNNEGLPGNILHPNAIWYNPETGVGFTFQGRAFRPDGSMTTDWRVDGVREDGFPSWWDGFGWKPNPRLGLEARIKDLTLMAAGTESIPVNWGTPNSNPVFFEFDPNLPVTPHQKAISQRSIFIPPGDLGSIGWTLSPIIPLTPAGNALLLEISVIHNQAITLALSKYPQYSIEIDQYPITLAADSLGAAVILDAAYGFLLSQKMTVDLEAYKNVLEYEISRSYLPTTFLSVSPVLLRTVSDFFK